MRDIYLANDLALDGLAGPHVAWNPWFVRRKNRGLRGSSENPRYLRKLSRSTISRYRSGSRRFR
jgi:hypothetical protein